MNKRETLSSEFCTFASCSPIVCSMSFHGAPTRLALVVSCKGCQRIIPAGISSIPDNATTLRCLQCGEVRQYRPSEVYEGRAPLHLIQGGKR